MSDPLDTVRDLAPQVCAHPELLERVRKDFMATITQSPQAAPGPERTRRRWAIPIVAAAVRSTATAGWAILA